MTIAELVAKCRENDPLIPEGHGYFVHSQGTDASATLYIPGSDGSGPDGWTADDLEIRMTPGGYILRYRIVDSDVWINAGIFEDFENLRAFVYEL